MAITDIPEFVEVGPGDLIRADDWNNIQRQIRNSVRNHRHSRLAALRLTIRSGQTTRSRSPPTIWQTRR